MNKRVLKSIFQAIDIRSNKSLFCSFAKSHLQVTDHHTRKETDLPFNNYE